MWSLPDINRMNSEAKSTKRKLERAVRHDGYYGSPDEGFFDCTDCNRIMTENYTWELYYVNTDDGQVCLPCYAERVLNDPERWIQLTDGNIDRLTFSSVRLAPHIIGVRMPVPKGIRFVDSVTFDSHTGGKVTGTESATSTPDPGVRDLQQMLRDLKAEGETKAILILDGGYQFAVSVGVYAPTKGGRFA